MDLIDACFSSTGTSVALNIDGAVIDSSVIGGTTPAAGTFTTLTANTSITGTLATAAQTNVTSVGTLTSLTVSGDATFDTSTLKVDSTNNRVGIGTASPSEMLTIKGDGADILLIDAGDGEMAKLGATGSNNALLELKNSSHSSKVLLSASGDSYLNGGSVGIGTGSPTNNLHVYKAASGRSWSADGGDVLAIENNDSVALDIRTPDSNQGLILFSDASARARGVFAYEHSSDDMYFKTAATEAMRIDSSGNLGLGTASPIDLAGQTSLTINGSVARADFKTSDIKRHSIITEAEYLAISVDPDNSTASSRFTVAVDGSERMRIDSNGDVGIGNTNPVQRLQVTGGNILIEGGSTESRTLGFTNAGGSTGWSIGNGVTAAAHQFVIYSNTAGAARMLIDSSGNTLHTVASQGSAFNAASDSTWNALEIFQDRGVTNSGSGIAFRSQSGTAPSGIVSVAGNTTGGIESLAFITSTGNASAEAMRIDPSGNVGIGCSPSATLDIAGTNTYNKINSYFSGSYISGFKFSDMNGGIWYDAQVDDLTVSAGHANSQLILESGGSEAMRLDASGRLLVGTTATGYPDGKLHAWTNTASQYAASFRHDGAATTSVGIGIICGTDDGSGTNTAISIQDGNGDTVGSVTFSGSTTAYNTSSDSRLKDITGEAKGLEIINQLKPVDFTWKKGGQKGTGLIAQEAMEHVPSAVVENPETGYYQMDYSKLVTPLVKAIQELSAEVEQLKQQAHEKCDN